MSNANKRFRKSKEKYNRVKPGIQRTSWTGTERIQEKQKHKQKTIETKKPQCSLYSWLLYIVGSTWVHPQVSWQCRCCHHFSFLCFLCPYAQCSLYPWLLYIIGGINAMFMTMSSGIGVK
jgi:hypothetical protein